MSQTSLNKKDFEDDLRTGSTDSEKMIQLKKAKGTIYMKK
jgi:hypothetical protein